MDASHYSVRVVLMMTAAFFCFVLGACTTMSRCEYDPTVGMNGGFEVSRSGLPVNWLIYAPDTIPSGDYELILDDQEYHSGSKALKFVVRQCSSTGGWHSPGFCNEFEASPGATYAISFWVKSDGAVLTARVGGVSAFDGEYETIVRTAAKLETWTLYQHDYAMPERFDTLRFEFNVLGPGTVWIDDVEISGIS